MSVVSVSLGHRAAQILGFGRDDPLWLPASGPTDGGVWGGRVEAALGSSPPTPIPQPATSLSGRRRLPR